MRVVRVAGDRTATAAEVHEALRRAGMAGVDWGGGGPAAAPPPTVTVAVAVPLPTWRRRAAVAAAEQHAHRRLFAEETLLRRLYKALLFAPRALLYLSLLARRAAALSALERAQRSRRRREERDARGERRTLWGAARGGVEHAEAAGALRCRRAAELAGRRTGTRRAAAAAAAAAEEARDRLLIAEERGRPQLRSGRAGVGASHGAGVLIAAWVRDGDGPLLRREGAERAAGRECGRIGVAGAAAAALAALREEKGRRRVEACEWAGKRFIRDDERAAARGVVGGAEGAARRAAATGEQAACGADSVACGEGRARELLEMDDEDKLSMAVEASLRQIRVEGDEAVRGLDKWWHRASGSGWDRSLSDPPIASTSFQTPDTISSKW
eukprot:gene31525-65812_t